MACDVEKEKQWELTNGVLQKFHSFEILLLNH